MIIPSIDRAESIILSQGFNIVGEKVQPGISRYFTFLRLKNLTESRIMVKVYSINEELKKSIFITKSAEPTYNERRYITILEPKETEEISIHNKIGLKCPLFKISSYNEMLVYTEGDIVFYAHYADW